jgi:hypothetical protein
MKYYLYISDTKLEMLYGQIPTRIRDRIAAELKIDLKVISATVTGKDRAESRYSKLDLVREYITKNLPVGTVEHPESYFMGTLVMRWAYVGTGRPEDAKLVYFGGEESNVVFGLVGSVQHMLGFGDMSVTRPPTWGGSYGLQWIVEQLVESLAAAMDDPELTKINSVGQLKHPRMSPLEAVAYTTRQLRHPTVSMQSLEFLAKRLVMGKSPVPGEEELNILLGTPLYVALADLCGFLSLSLPTRKLRTGSHGRRCRPGCTPRLSN